MVDVVDSQKRSLMMAGIRGKHTRPELVVRRALHARGLRYRLHKKLGVTSPDIVLPQWKVAVFVHGCFWHWHGCSLSKLPSNNAQFWERKLARNVDRDELAALTLVALGWRVATVWECALRGAKARAGFDAEMDRLAAWIRRDSETRVLEISGAAV
jgi:DNA mismatch endonuclease, patch repair protein